MPHASVLAALLLLASCASTQDAPASPTSRPAAASPAVTHAPARAVRAGGDRDRGGQLFAELGCKGCHGGEGEGGGIGPDLFAMPWSPARQASARAVILRGFPDEYPPMPPYQGQIDDAALDDLLAYVGTK